MNQNIPLDSRSQSILNELLKTDENNYISITQLSKLLNVSKRSIYYDLCKINDWITTFKLPEINVERSKGLFLDQLQKEKLLSLNQDTVSSTYYQFLPLERINVIICALLGSNHVINVDQLINLCYVSRNTIIADMNVVKTELAYYDLKVVVEKRNGFRIKGDTIRKRAVFLHYFLLLMPLYMRGVLQFIDYQKVKQILGSLETIESKLNTRYVEGILTSLAALLSLSDNKFDDVSFKDIEIATVVDTREYVYTKEMFPNYPEQEQTYIAIHLLGSRIQVAPNMSISSRKDQEIFELTRNLITEFERLACIEFSERQEIERSIFVHLKMSIYRYRYGIQIGNPLFEQVKTNYPELFEITKRVMQYVSKSIGVPISDHETAYLTLHFGGHMKSGKLREIKTSVALYCPEGLANLKILQREIEVISNNLIIHPCLTMEELHATIDQVDVVITTTDLSINRPTIKVQPILNETSKSVLMNQLSKYTSININQNFIDNLLTILSKYVAPSNYNQVKNEITAFYRNHVKGAEYFPGILNPSILEVLHPEDIIICNKKVSWDESIRMTAQPLLNSNKIQAGYVDNMLNNIIQQGPYIYLEPGLAIAHSRPEDGVNSLGLSMGIFSKGVEFSEDLVANVILVLAPIDHETHLKILREIMAFFGVMANFKELISIKSSKEAFSLLKSKNDSEELLNL